MSYFPADCRRLFAESERSDRTFLQTLPSDCLAGTVAWQVSSGSDKIRENAVRLDHVNLLARMGVDPIARDEEDLAE